MINKICGNDLCFWCALCESVCPKHAIRMEIANGFYRPVISDSCISCGVCIDNCPAKHHDRIVRNSSPSIAYASWCKDNELYFASTSGGLAYHLSYSFIQKGGLVVGVWFNPGTKTIEHRLYETTDELHLVRGSRYVNSNKKDIYRIADEKLKEKDVLFIGVPCEVNAMKQFVTNKLREHRLDSVVFNTPTLGSA